MYIHHDASVLTNVFCTHLLGCESVMQVIEKDFVIWGWDFTFESNKHKFCASLANYLAPHTVTNLKDIPVDRLPALVLLAKMRSSIEVFNVIKGKPYFEFRNYYIQY